MSHWSIVPLSSISKVSSTYLTFSPKDIFSTYLACSFYDMYLFILSFHTVLSCLFSLTFLKFSSPKSSQSSVLYIFSLRFHFDIHCTQPFLPLLFHIDLSPLFSPPPPSWPILTLSIPEISKPIISSPWDLTLTYLIPPWDLPLTYFTLPLISHID